MASRVTVKIDRVVVHRATAPDAKHLRTTLGQELARLFGRAGDSTAHVPRGSAGGDVARAIHREVTRAVDRRTR